MSEPKVYADFHNADAQGRLRLNCVGTVTALARQQVQLQPGLVLTLYSDDADDVGRPAELLVTGVVERSDAEQCWVARIDWSAIQRVTLAREDRVNGVHAEHSTPSTNLT